MRKMSIHQIVEEYKKNAIEYGNSLIEKGSDYRKTNRAYKKMAKLFSIIRNDDVLVERILSTFLKSDDLRIKTQVAVHCLALNKHVDEAQQVLKEVSEMKDLHLLSFDAEKTLEVWTEQGYLKL